MESLQAAAAAQQQQMFLSHGGRPTKGNGRKRKGVDEYAAENRIDFTSRSIIRDGQLVRILVCRFCCQSIGARSDRIKEHLASKRHQKLKLEAFREAAEAGRDLSQEYSDDSVSGLLPEPPITMLKFPGKALAHLLEGGGLPPEGREMTPEAEDRKPVMPTPPPLKEHMLSSPPPSGLGMGGGRICGPTPPPSHHHHHHHSHQQSNQGHGHGHGGQRSATPQKESHGGHNNHGGPAPPQQLLCVRWGNFDSNIVSMFTKLRSAEHFVDATLWCEGKTIKCHKMILSACSTYFEKLLTENPNPHPIIFLKDMRFWEITALVEFMYRGEVSIHQDKLQSLLRAAESLQIKGLGSPSANDGPNGLETQGLDQGAESGDDMSNGTLDMSNSSSYGGNLSNSNSIVANLSSSIYSHSPPSLLNMSGGVVGGTAVGIDLSNHGIQSSPLALSLSSNNSNPAKRRKKENPRRLELPRATGLPLPMAMPIPVFNSSFSQNEREEEEYESEDESNNHQSVKCDEGAEGMAVGGVGDEDDGNEGGLQVDEGKSDSEGEGGGSGPGQDMDMETDGCYSEERDENGALSLRVARKGGIKINNNNNNEGAAFSPPSAAAE